MHKPLLMSCRLYSCLSGVLLALWLWSPFCLATDGVLIVSNKEVVAQSLTTSQAKAIFSMRSQQWSNGSPIKVFVLSDRHPLHDLFCKSLLDVFPHQLRTAWDRQVFSGTGQAPITVDSEEDMLTRVATTPGAIGYLRPNHADTSKVKVIEVKGERYE